MEVPRKYGMHMAVRILRRPMVQSRTGLSRSAIYLKIAQGNFPRPISLGARSVGWIDAEIDKWLSDRINLSRAGRVGSVKWPVRTEGEVESAALAAPLLRRPITSFVASPASSKQKVRRPLVMPLEKTSHFVGSRKIAQSRGSLARSASGRAPRQSIHKCE